MRRSAGCFRSRIRPAARGDAMKLRIFRAARAVGFARRIISRCLALAAITFALSAWSAAAQTTTTYTYVGAPLDIAYCQQNELPRLNSLGLSGFTCIGGNVNATVSFMNLPLNYSGDVLCGSTSLLGCNAGATAWSFSVSAPSVTLNSAVSSTCPFLPGLYNGTYGIFSLSNGVINNHGSVGSTIFEVLCEYYDFQHFWSPI